MENCFRIISPVYNAEKWIHKCINSVRDQTHTNFHHIIVDDCSRDRTAEKVKACIKGDSRFTLIEKSQRMGVPHSQKLGVELSNSDPEDIIVQLDGDDWLVDNFSLEKLSKVYDDEDCWLTYGSYITTTGAECVAREYTDPPRQAVGDGWPFSHLRTFKRHVWDHLSEEDFLDDNGNLYTAAADVVIFVPILEKIGYDKVRFIKEVLVVYNLSNDLNEHKTNLQEQVRTALNVIKE